MKISTIITAYNVHEVTIAHVKACMEGTVMPYEVIVVNDGGDPNLLEMLKKVEKKCPITYALIEEDIPWNYTGARNLGVWLSRGEYLAIEDNDTIPSVDFYKKALELIKEGYDKGWLSFSGIAIQVTSLVMRVDRLDKQVEKLKTKGAGKEAIL